jgi:hypothetical protein
MKFWRSLKFSGIWLKNYNLWWQGFCINKSIFTYGLLYDLLHFFWHVLLVMDDRFIQWEMVFCYQNCSDLLWEKNVLLIKKNFWKLEAKFLRSLKQFIQTVKGQNKFSEQNAFLTCFWRFLISNKLKQLEFKLKTKNIGI